MPRKQVNPLNDEPRSAPGRTRKSAVKAAQTAASPGRPRFLSSEEKRELILAHAANREPVDSVQRFSLWTGVAICILAIGIGWIYTMRETIAGAIESTDRQNDQEAIDYTELKQTLHTNINEMVDKIDNLQDVHLDELREQAVLIKTIQEASNATTSSSTPAVPVQDNELFQPSQQINTTDFASFQLPGGVVIDN